MTTYRLIGPFSQIITFENAQLNGPIPYQSDSLISEHSWILFAGNTIEALGSKADLLDMVSNKSDLTIDEIEGNAVAIPGIIDSHTHICFGGSRYKDYAARNAGVPYLEIAKQGGGIKSSVKSTRESSEVELMQGILRRTQEMALRGVTTAEVKSGYGLSVEAEIKMLKSIQEANCRTELDLIPTCLAAHTIPKMDGLDESTYLELIKNEILPQVKSQNLSNRVDIFIEKESFTKDLSTAYLLHAKELGFDITVHADQFSVGGSEVAANVGAVSADHLENSTEREIAKLVKANVVCTALPGASIGLGEPFTPARKILDEGGILSIASDWNPGSAPQGHLVMQASVLGTFQKLTNEELLAGITFRAAAALNLEDRGKLSKGLLADMTVFPVGDFNEIFYYQGMVAPSYVYKNGKELYKKLLNP